MKSITNDELLEIVGLDFEVDKQIFQLSQQGLIITKDGSYTLKPEALKSIIEFLKKLRMVW